MEACLRAIAEEHRGTQRLAATMQKLLKTLNLLRKAAGTVRDLDVQSKLILELASQGRGQRHANNVEDSDAERVRSLCKERRKDAADRLKKLLTSHEIKLERSLAAVTTALEGLRRQEAAPAATAARWMKKAVRSDKKLSKSALHNFRKQTKLARYLAEMQPDSQQASQLAKELHAVQNAIGKWHDLDLIVGVMKPLLGKHAPLRNRAQLSRRKALRTARTLLHNHSGSFRKQR
jgi:CHAD domain-containing protein